MAADVVCKHSNTVKITFYPVLSSGHHIHTSFTMLVNASDTEEPENRQLQGPIPFLRTQEFG
jgi:hypothetical protein